MGVLWTQQDGALVRHVPGNVIGSLSTRDFEDDAVVRSAKAWV